MALTNIIEVILSRMGVKASKLSQKSLNFLRTGYYGRSNGYIYTRITNGGWWSFTAGSTTHGHNVGTHPTNVDLQDSSYRGFGIAVRCVVREG